MSLCVFICDAGVREASVCIHVALANERNEWEGHAVSEAQDLLSFSVSCSRLLSPLRVCLFLEMYIFSSLLLLPH